GERAADTRCRQPANVVLPIQQLHAGLSDIRCQRLLEIATGHMEFQGLRLRRRQEHHRCERDCAREPECSADEHRSLPSSFGRCVRLWRAATNGAVKSVTIHSETRTSLSDSSTLSPKPSCNSRAKPSTFAASKLPP